jgi:predicted MFS family arabinose efflux permease
MSLTVPTLLRVFLPFALGYFLSYVYRMVNAVLAPNLVNDLGLEPAALGLLTSAYFLAFAAFQLPLGVLLDRYGPRRVEAILLLFAALGAFIFAQAESLGTLILGRALIGLGVSACLMAAFKAFTQWLPPERLPFANGVQMVSGGMGALFATAPVEAVLHVTDWRGVFTGLSVLTLFAAAVIFFIVPRSHEKPTGESLREELQGVVTIYTSAKFWRIAPLAILAQSAFLAIPGLWAGPWLRDMAGLDRDGVAFTLLVLSVAMIVGYFFYGLLTERLARRGIPPTTVVIWAIGGFLGVQVLLVWGTVLPPALTLFLFGFGGTACILPYAILSQTFPSNLAGRANTALNMPCFLAAFLVQWAIGAIIGLWPETAAGGYDPAGYRMGFGIILLLQVVAAGWYLLAGRRERARAYCSGG